jgi:hypothetical protein
LTRTPCRGVRSKERDLEYTTRIGDTATEAHINYSCPCGCAAGLIYERDEGPQHLGRCCCGRLLWVGPQAVAVVRSHFDVDVEYGIDIGSVTLPWGEQATTALAIPFSELEEHDHEGHEHEHDHH